MRAIEDDLLSDGLVRRYRPRPEVDGLPPGEGVVSRATSGSPTTTSFRAAMTDAQRLFERLLTCCNDVGLLAEQYDPAANRLLGNFPQAFSPVMLINTARDLARRHGPAEERPE